MSLATSCCTAYCPSPLVVNVPGAPGPSGSTLALATGSWADPNGNVTPDDEDSGGFYYQDPILGPNNWWLWSISAHVWVQVAGA